MYYIIIASWAAEAVLSMFDMYLSLYSASGEISAFVVLMRARIVILIGFNISIRVSCSSFYASQEPCGIFYLPSYIVGEPRL